MSHAATAPPPPNFRWRRGLEMLTHGAESSPRNPRNPPEKRLGGRVRWSLGMHSEESVAYLLAELGEPSLSQPLPPRPVCPTSPSPFSSLFCSLTYPNAPRLLAPPLPSSYWQTLAFLAPHWPPSGLIQPPAWPLSPCCSPSSCKRWGHELMMSAKQMSVGMWVKLGSLWSTARVQEVPHTVWLLWEILISLWSESDSTLPPNPLRAG